MPQLYELTISGAGEVRDAFGNLIDSPTIESKITVTEEQLRELGLTPEGDQS